MFCENCGHQVNPGEKFCQNCGSPLNYQPAAQPTEPVEPIEPAQPVQPEYTQPAEQAQPVQPEYQPEFAQDAVPAAPMQDNAPQYTPAAPKKPMSKGLKMGLIFGGAGAVVVIALLIVIFAVIVPNASKVDAQKYFTANINGISDMLAETIDSEPGELTVADGAISGYFEFDYGMFAKEKGIDLSKAESSENPLYVVSSYIDVDVELKDGTGEADYYSFKNASKDNVYTVKLSWPQNGLYAMALEEAEKNAGTRFKHDNVTFELKMSDLLERKGVKVKESVEADVLSYIKDNNLIYTEGTSGSADAYVKGFETKINGYTFKKSDYSMNVDVLGEDGKNVTYFYLEFDNDGSLKDGDTIKLNYDEYYISEAAGAGIKLTGEPVEYKVKAEVPATEAATEAATSAASQIADTTKAPVDTSNEKGLTAKQASDAKASLKEFFDGKVSDFIKNDSDAKEGDKLELKAVYYSHATDGDFRRMMFIYENTTQKYFKSMATNPEDFLVKDGKVQLEGTYMYFSDEGKGKTLDEAVEATWYLSNSYKKYYENTEIKY